MSKKIKAAIIGSGNIGTDLLYKALRSEVIEPVWMVGIEAGSEGLARARQLGLKCTSEGVAGLEPHIVADNIQIAWDATSAYVHEANNDIVKKYGGKRYVRHFTCWNQLLCIVFGQLSNRDRLRDLVS